MAVIKAEEAVDNDGYSNAEYDALWTNRRERKRTTTDVACLIIYGTFIVTWIGIMIYAYCHSKVSPCTILGSLMKSVWAGLFNSPAIFFFSWFCVLLIVFYFIMLRWCTKFTVYLTIILEFIFISLPFVTISFEVYSTAVVPIFIVLFSYILFMIEIQILKKVGIDFVCNIIVLACKATIALPLSSLLIAFLSLFTTALLSIFIGSVIYCLGSTEHVRIELSYETSPYTFYPREEIYTVNNTGLIITFLISSVWILLVNCLSMQSTLHGMFTSWCRISSKSTIPSCTILRHLFYTYRYHIGSFAFMSIPMVPIIQIIRTVCSNVQLLKMKLKESPYNIYCFLVIIGNLFTTASVVCATYGKCFYPSMKDAYKVLIQNPMKFAAARLVTIGMIIFGLILVPSIVIGTTWMYITIWNISNYQIDLVVISSISIVITSGVFFIFSAAIDSVLFCHLEELLNKNKESDENFLK